MATAKQPTSVITARRLAQLLRIHNNTVTRWSSRGILTPCDVNRSGQPRFRQEDIAHFLLQANRNGKKQKRSSSAKS